MVMKLLKFALLTLIILYGNEALSMKIKAEDFPTLAKLINYFKESQDIYAHAEDEDTRDLAAYVMLTELKAIFGRTKDEKLFLNALDEYQKLLTLIASHPAEEMILLDIRELYNVLKTKSYLKLKPIEKSKYPGLYQHSIYLPHSLLWLYNAFTQEDRDLALEQMKTEIEHIQDQKARGEAYRDFLALLKDIGSSDTQKKLGSQKI